MKHFKYVFLSACTAATLVVGSLSAYAAPKVATLPIASVQSSEVKEALAQNWIPKALQEKAGSYSAVTEKDFNDALFAASKAAGASLDMTLSQAEESLSREKAASLLDKIIKVPYAKKFVYNDIPQNSPYESSILNVRQAELMNGISFPIIRVWKTTHQRRRSRTRLSSVQILTSFHASRGFHNRDAESDGIRPVDIRGACTAVFNQDRKNTTIRDLP